MPRSSNVCDRIIKLQTPSPRGMHFLDLSLSCPSLLDLCQIRFNQLHVGTSDGHNALVQQSSVIRFLAVHMGSVTTTGITKMPIPILEKHHSVKSGADRISQHDVAIRTPSNVQRTRRI